MADLHPHPPPPPPPPAPPLPLPSATPTTTPLTTTTNLDGQSLGPKRQRRPSVRLGDIGGEPSFDNPSFRRPKSSFRYHKDPSALKTSKTRPLTNLFNKNGTFFERFDYVVSSDHNGENSNPDVEFSHKKPKLKKPIKRARTNWPVSSKFENMNDPLIGGLGVSGFGNGDNDNHNEFRGFEVEGSKSPVREQEHSPLNSRECLDVIRGLEFRDRRDISGARVSESSRGHDEIEGREHNNDDEFRSSSVKDWLIGLGLGRYAPNFEIHEVDDEVLPMLTMEDLKDMGINAVGSRRKMCTAIEKLRKEFS